MIHLYIDQIRQLPKDAPLPHFGKGICIPASHCRSTTPRQNCGWQHCYENIDVPQICPPNERHTFLHEVGQTFSLISIFGPMHLTPPKKPGLQPPEQHVLNLIPHGTPPSILQHLKSISLLISWLSSWLGSSCVFLARETMTIKTNKKYLIFIMAKNKNSLLVHFQ